jgi:glycosyltransferase involved in cell wall biosynthesis
MLSVIIPTHNRVESLGSALRTILDLKGEIPLEVVVVDNNSTDSTRQEVEKYSARHPGLVRYAFERRTAFTKARSTGAENAKGDVLLYIDDDVLLVPGSLRRIHEVFSKHPDAGMIAGKITLQYSQEPPPWTLRCQEAFNGWSSFEPFENGEAAQGAAEVSWAAGPMLAVRKDLYDKVGGFPPDTIGIETNTGLGTFKKLYVGPGDVGLSKRIKEAGFKIYFSNDIACHHVIPPIRFTIKFWRSRMIGEGHFHAVSRRQFQRLSPVDLFLERMHAYAQYLLRKDMLADRLPAGVLGRVRRFVLRAVGHDSVRQPVRPVESGMRSIGETRRYAGEGDSGGVYTEELWVYFFKAYLEADYFLSRHGSLGSFLWRIASDGVEDNEFEKVMSQFPEGYRKVFLEESSIYNDMPLRSVKSLAQLRLLPEVEARMRSAEIVLRRTWRLSTEYVHVTTEEAASAGYGPSEETIRLAEQAAREDPTDRLFLLTGCLHYKAGDKARAVDCFKKALQSDPEDQECLDLLKYAQIPG